MFLPSQKNLFLKSIQQQGLHPRDFSLVAADELKLIHKSTGFYFRVVIVEKAVTVNGVAQSRLVSFSTPKRQGVIVDETQESTYGGSEDWTKANAFLSHWLTWLKQEFEEPDLWAEMEQEPHLFEDAEVITEERFTEVEIKLLEARVPEMEQQVIDLNLPPDAQAAITAIVRRVPAKAKNFTKKDLSDALVGSFVRVGFKWQLSTADIGEVWLIAQRFFTLAIS
jgi:hypothetical protein